MLRVVWQVTERTAPAMPERLALELAVAAVEDLSLGHRAAPSNRSSSRRRRCTIRRMRAPASAIASRTASATRSASLPITSNSDASGRGGPRARRLRSAADDRGHGAGSADLDQLDGDALVGADEIAEATMRDEPAGVEGDDVVADPLDLFQQVRREHHVDRELVADLLDERQHLVALHGVEAVGRLVEEDRRGSAAIAWASLTRWRWPVDIDPSARKRSSPSPTSQSASLARPRASARACRAPLRGASRSRTRACPRGARCVRARSRRARAAPTLGARVETEHLARSGGGQPQPEHDAHERRLARPVGADQPGHARLDVTSSASRARLLPNCIVSPVAAITPTLSIMAACHGFVSSHLRPTARRPQDDQRG